MLDDYTLEIKRVSDGFIIRHRNEGFEDYEETPGVVPTIESVVSDSDLDELSSGQELLWRVMDYFGLGGDRYDKERLTITRERGDKYEGPSAGERA